MRKKRNNNKRPLRRTVLSSNVNVKRVTTKDLSTYFKIRYDGFKGKLNKISSCTVIEDDEVTESYIIFKRRLNGTWEMIITEDISENIDDIVSINMYHDRKLKDL